MRKLLTIAIIALNTFVATAQKNVTIIGYIPAYRVQLMDQMNLSALTHVIAAFANPDSNGTMSCPIDLETFSAKVRAAGSKPVISIGGGGSYSWGADVGIYHHLYSDDNRKDFIIKLANYCEQYQCEGIDLDIEGNALAHSGYDAFASELADTLHARGLEIYGVYGVGGQWSAVNASDETLQKLDFIGTMSYGGVGSWNWNKPSNQATFERFKSDIEYFVNRGVEPSKVHGGIPFYSVGFPKDSVSNFSPYFHIISYLATNDFYTNQNAFYVDTMINSEGQPEYFSGFNTNKRKIDFCDSIGSGLMIWEMGQDNYSGSGPNMLDSITAYIDDATNTKPDKSTFKKYLGKNFNLAGSKLEINITGNTTVSMSIKNLKGRTLLNSRYFLHEGLNHIDFSNLKLGKGIYFATLTDIKNNINMNVKFYIP